MFGIRCRLSLLFPAVVTVLLLQQPDGLTLPCLLASLMHECGHLLAMLALGIPPEDCTLGAFGARIRLGGRLAGYGRSLLVALAGPLTNVLAAGILLTAARPATAAVHLILALFNLLPAAALDGGEILCSCLGLLGLESLSGWLLRFTSALVLLPLAAVSIWMYISGTGNLTLPVVSAYLTGLVFFSEKIEKTY